MSLSSKIILKKSSVSGKIPQTTDLEFGELALNFADGVLYYRSSTDSVLPLVNSENGGTGDFTGVETDSTLTGNGLSGNELGVNYPTINIAERSGTLFAIKLFPYLGMLLRYDDMQRDPIGIVFDRNDNALEVAVG